MAKPKAKAAAEAVHTESGGVATLDPPEDVAEATFGIESDPHWQVIDGKAVWAQEQVEYLFDPESRELQGARIRVCWDDGQIGETYEAQIRRDGLGDSWAWWEGDRFLGTHQPTIQLLIGRALHRGRGKVLHGIT